jgi:hypothetical protein
VAPCSTQRPQLSPLSSTPPDRCRFAAATPAPAAVVADAAAALPLPCRCWLGAWGAGCLLPQIVSEDAVASEVLEADEFEAATQDSLHYARTLVTQAVDAAAAEVGCRHNCWAGRWVGGVIGVG